MQIITTVLLAILAIALFSSKKLLSNDTLERAANVGGVVATIAALLVLAFYTTSIGSKEEQATTPPVAGSALTPSPRLTDIPIPSDTLIPTNTLTATLPPPTATVIPPSPTPAIQLPFEDAFDLRPKPEWESIAGTWRVVDGHLVPDINDARHQIILVGDDNWKNYTVSVVIYTKFCSGAGIITRVTNDGYMEFDYDGDSFRWKLIRNGQEVTIANVQRNCFDSHLIGIYDYKVSVDHDIFTGYVDGQQILQVQDSTYSYGGVGLVYSMYTNPTWFDNFKVTTP